LPSALPVAPLEAALYTLALRVQQTRSLLDAEF